MDSMFDVHEPSKLVAMTEYLYSDRGKLYAGFHQIQSQKYYATKMKGRIRTSQFGHVAALIA